MTNASSPAISSCPKQPILSSPRNACQIHGYAVQSAFNANLMSFVHGLLTTWFCYSMKALPQRAFVRGQRHCHQNRSKQGARNSRNKQPRQNNARTMTTYSQRPLRLSKILYLPLVKTLLPSSKQIHPSHSSPTLEMLNILNL